MGKIILLWENKSNEKLNRNCQYEINLNSWGKNRIIRLEKSKFLGEMLKYEVKSQNDKIKVKTVRF